MSFAQPTYLWALLGLLVPIVIHLWSKKEAKTIKIGSVQLLSESTSKQSSTIQLNEWWLLVLRMLIISLITLVMAKPQWYSKVDTNKLTYIVEPSFLQNENFIARFNNLEDGQEVRLLEDGLPIREDEVILSNDTNNPDYWSLASEMNALKTDSIIVFTKGYATGLKGSRPETNHRIHWIIIDSVKVNEKPLIAYKNEERIQLYSITSNTTLSEISSQNIKLGEEYSLTSEEDSLFISTLKRKWKVPVVQQDPIEVNLFYADSLSIDRNYIQAALAALSDYVGWEIIVKSKVDSEVIEKEKPDLTIWLSTKEAPVPDHKLLLYKKDTIAASLISVGEDDSTFYLNRRITSENALSERLTENLLRILNINGEVKDVIAAVDMRTVTETDLQTNYKPSNKKKTQLAGRNLNPYVWGLLFVMLLLERFVALKRKQ